MQLHQLKPIHQKKTKKRVGRGAGCHGTYSGRGQKGQNSRAGTKFQPVVRYLIKRYPKLRGYRHRKQRGRLGFAKKDKFIGKTAKNPDSKTPAFVLTQGRTSAGKPTVAPPSPKLLRRPSKALASKPTVAKALAGKQTPKQS